MEITLMVNNSEKNKIGKTTTTIKTINGALRGETSLMAPTVLVECSIEEVKNANYMYINDFNKYYFISDISSIRTGLVEISASVDLLETYKASILSHSAIIQRQEHQWNTLLVDGEIKSYADKTQQIINFPESLGSSLLDNYVLTVLGGENL